MNNFVLRATSGLIYVFLIAFISMYSPWGLIIGLGFLFILCFWELQKILDFDNLWYAVAAFAASAYLFGSYAYRFYHGQSYEPFSFIALMPSLLFFMLIYIIFKRLDEIAYDTSKLIFMAVYLGIPFALVFRFMHKSELNDFQNFTPLFLIFALIWFSDTFAYITGSLIGKTTFTKISQNKTLEGLAGGFISVLILGAFIQYYLTNIRGNWIVISILIGIFAPLGDLAESKIKRLFGVKDSGNLIPGHGGFLDRLDSFLMVSVVVYTYYMIFEL
ncbi:phosphatidate cytidylyltransferase [Ornithobacterium rhinotracheale]|uniref:phosphatidate cytidylyltransferase n=1 Tax=Ornithobacterium rhinotracheale TaxID=28251 RepID=UPI00129C12F4|nr:phosphatidate cytidylyltransferase [Ornithobacterium rhinotracheale]MRJ08597.1 phosphatidate cytidylyltransferase [Ornithobacterium rhinotracheale]UOH76957.1 phosphatidate cytidylyltransferase [Ornithobacterium rhinotracheale]